MNNTTQIKKSDIKGNGSVLIEFRSSPRQGKSIYTLTLNVGTEHEKVIRDCFSRKQLAYKYAEKFGFNLYKKLLAKINEAPTFYNDPNAEYNRRLEREEERLADICDDLNCSVAEARHFQKTGEHPRGW
ncbi:MAG: hypothetical protein CMF45_08855 [Legionellales bacterium]|nr:hypothetical protein [Legionellales bacterium]|tara:strand:- start:2710 stop:3096 length:387 start_codon:yes stop_codon:yes gene_type:complete